MQNVIIVILLVLLATLVIICACSTNTEVFTAEFNNARSSTEYINYIDMGDHKTMAYLQRGDSGDTVLLLHNSPLNLSIWLPLYHTMQRISMSGIKTPTLVAYDMRGHGSAWLPVEPKYNDSNVNNYAWSLEQLVQDCKKIYDNVIGGGKIKICGFGFGGIVAQKFALTYPDLITKLILLQSSIRPMPGLQDEINYLSGPNGWIARNPHVSYLTPEERFVQQTLCEWFVLPKSDTCTFTPLMEKFNDQLTPQYNTAASLWRESSATTALQADKLLVSTNMVPEWQNAKNVPFTIHILAASNDPLAPPEMMTNTYTTIYNNNRRVVVAFDIVEGRHGFTIMRPDYIAGIICDDCMQLSTIDTAFKTSYRGY